MANGVCGVSVKAKPTHQNIIRLAPPLVITEEQIDRAVGIFAGALRDLVCTVLVIITDACD